MGFKSLAILILFVGFVLSLSQTAFAACASGHSCSLATVANTTCFNNNPFDCQWMGGLTYCYVQNATCASDKPCYDPAGLEGAHCHCDEGAKTCSSSTVKKVCSGNSWTSTTCAANYRCSGGDCVLDCSNTTASTGCYNNDVYYYDNCGNRQSMKTDCGNSSTGSNTCSGNNVVRTDYSRGCSAGACYSNATNVLVQTCGTGYRCSGGSCVLDCSNTTASTGCYNNDVYYYDNCGNRQSMKTDCGTSSTGPNYCSGNSVYRTDYARGCSNSSCYSNGTNVWVQDCTGGQVCSAGACVAAPVPSITGYSLSPASPSLVVGQSFTINYTVTYGGASSVTGTIGASIYRNGDTANTEYVDPSGDKVVTINVGTNSFSRTFKIPSNAAPGTYRISLGLWKTAFTERWSPNYEPSGYPITVQQDCSNTTASTACYNDDLYYYDNCGNRQSMKTDCGVSSTGTNFCSGNSVYRTDFARGCSSNACYANGTNVKVADCTNGQVCSAGACVAVPVPSITGYSLSPASPSVAAGQSFTINYTVTYNGSSSVTGTIGASIYRNGDTANTEYVDPSGDKVVTINVGTNSFSRTFKIPSGTPAGTYRISLGLWKTAFTERWSPNYEPSGYPISVTAQPSTNPYILGYSLTPSTVSGAPGSSFSISYTIVNPGSSSVSGLIGASIFMQDDTSNTEYTDPAGDKTVTIAAGTGTYSRTFSIPSNAPAGTYRISLGLWKTAFTERWSPNYEPSGYPITVSTSCALSNASWSKSTAFQWDSIQMSVDAPGCDGKTMTFTIKEDDGLFGADYVQQGTAAVSNGKAVLSWAAAYIEDQYANPEFYFIAGTDGKTAKSGEMKVYPGAETQKFSQLSAIAASGLFRIITYDFPSAYAAGYIDSLRSKLVAKNGNSSSFYQSSVANCWDYPKLGSNLVLIGSKATNKVISCLSSADRAQVLTGSQIEIIENPWATGKYIIIVQASDSYIDGIAALAIMVEKGASPELKNKDYLIGCLTAGSENNFGMEVACNIVPVVELVYDVRDSFNCIKADSLKWVDPAALDSQTLVDKIICDVTYAISAFDVVSTVGMVVSFGVSEIPAEGLDAVLSTLKVSFKKAATLATKETLVDITKVMDGMTLAKKFATLKSLGSLLRNVPNVTDDVIKASLKLLSNGPGVAENSFTFLNKRPAMLKIMDPAKAIEGVAYIFKAEKETGIKMAIDASDGYAKNALSMAADDSIFLKLKAVSENLGIPYGNIKEVRFVDSVAVGDEALGYYDEGIIYIRSKEVLGLSGTKFAELQKFNTLPHEMTHSKFANELGSPSTVSALQTEEYMVDRLIRRDLAGDDLLKYRQYEAFQMDKVTAGQISGGIAAAEKDGLAEAAALYAKADAYDGVQYLDAAGATQTMNSLYVKSVVETGIRNAASAKGLTSTQTETAIAAFRKYAGDMKAAGDNYIDTHGFFPPGDISLTGATARATSTEIGSVSTFSTGAEEAVLAASSSSAQTISIKVPKDATVTSAAVRISGDAQ